MSTIAAPSSAGVVGASAAPMRGRFAATVVVAAGGLLLVLLMFGGAFQPSAPPTFLPGTDRSAVFDPSALSRPLDFPKPVEEYFVPPPRFTPTPAFPKKLHVLITGGAGFIGSQLGYKLHALGHEVTLIDNFMFGYRDNIEMEGVGRFGRLVVADILDPRIQQYFRGVDVVFHFAALSALPVCQSHPRDAMSINVGGVASVLDASRRAGARFILASTSAVYETNTEPVLTEDLPVSPHLLYSLSKFQAELLARAVAATNGVEVVILRFFNVYGPHQDFRRTSPPFTSYLIRELIHGRTPVLHSDGEQQRDYVHVDDLMELAKLVMTHPAAVGETFNVASGEPVSVNDIYRIVASALNSTVRPKYRPASRFWDAYKQLFDGKNPIKKEILEKEVTKRTVGSYAKAAKVLGWKPKVSMRDGLRSMVAYVKRNSRYSGAGSSNAKSAWKADD